MCMTYMNKKTNKFFIECGQIRATPCSLHLHHLATFTPYSNSTNMLLHKSKLFSFTNMLATPNSMVL